MKLSKKSLLVTAALLAGTSAAMAGEPSCSVPKEQWMKEADFRAKVEADGVTIKRFKVNSGKCYEVYGTDKSGKKVENFYDPATGAQIH